MNGGHENRFCKPRCAACRSWCLAAPFPPPSAAGDAYVNDAYGESEVTLSFDIKAAVGEINLEGEPAPVAAEPEPAPEVPADDEVAQDDALIEKAGVGLVVDAMSYPYLEGAEVDYVEDLSGAQFVVTNPNAASTCGCGNSFSI